MSRRPEDRKGERGCRVLTVGLLILSLLLWDSPGLAAERAYPNRPVSLIIPYNPGATIDLGSRVLAERMEKNMGQPLVFTYKPGAGGALGTALAAKAKSDGYTVLSSTSTSCLFTIVRKVDYKWEDFIPIGIYAEVPVRMYVKNASRWKTLRDFVEEARRSPGELKVGSHGKLTSPDFAIISLSQKAGIKLNNIPFKSTSEAITAVLGGHVDAAMVTTTGGQGGREEIRMLATTAARRLEDNLEVPTFKELGYPVVLSLAYSFAVFKGTPKEVVETLWHAQKKALDEYGKEIKEKLRKVEMYPNFLSPAESMERYRQEYDWVYKICDEIGVVAK